MDDQKVDILLWILKPQSGIFSTSPKPRLLSYFAYGHYELSVQSLSAVPLPVLKVVTVTLKFIFNVTSVISCTHYLDFVYGAAMRNGDVRPSLVTGGGCAADNDNL